MVELVFAVPSVLGHEVERVVQEVVQVWIVESDEVLVVEATKVVEKPIQTQLLLIEQLLCQQPKGRSQMQVDRLQVRQLFRLNLSFARVLANLGMHR